MRFAHFLWVVLLGIPCSGCALVEDASRNTCFSLSSVIDKHRENARNRQWAEAAWQEASEKQDLSQRTEDYARGFKDGYADYLFRGGDGEPPLIAPDRYRHLRYQNPQGYQAVEEWFAGYRHGAGVARDTKARQWITGPSALAPETHGAEMADALSHTPPPAVGKPKEFPPAPDPLPNQGCSARAPVEITVAPFPDPVTEPAQIGFGQPQIIAPAESSEPIPTNAEIGIGTEVPDAPPGPARAKITNVSAGPAERVRVRITNVSEPPGAPVRPDHHDHRDADQRVDRCTKRYAEL